MKKRYTILFTIFFGIIAVILLVCLIIMPDERNSFVEVSNNNYAINYDGTWNLKEQQQNYVLLSHDGNTLEFLISQLTQEQKELKMEYLIQDIIQVIKKEHPEYQLITGNDKLVTKEKYQGYTLLYENGDSQTMITIARKSDQLLLINYTATDESFDVLLDSAENVIYQFKLLDKKITMNNNLSDISISKIKFDNTTYQYKETKEYEIASNHYQVKYLLPELFQITNFSTINPIYRYIGDDYNTIQVTTQVQNMNLYEVLTEEEYGTIPYIKKELEKNEKVSNIKIENDKTDYGYIYQITYQYQLLDTTQERQQVYMFYALDPLKTFVIQIESDKMAISNQLLQDIKVTSIKKYSSNIEKVMSNGYLKGTMRTFLLGNYNSYYNVKYQVKQSYTELDYNQNMEDTRYFGYNYQPELEDYAYIIQLHITNTGNVSSEIEAIKNTYSFYKNVKIVRGKNYTLNGRAYAYLTVTYTINNQLKQNSYLICNLGDKGTYSIRVSSDNKIPFQMLSDFTMFSLEKQQLN